MRERLWALGVAAAMTSGTATAAERSTTEPTVSEPSAEAPVEATPVDTTFVEAAPVETAPVETTPVETTPVQTEPVETEPVETEPVAGGRATIDVGPQALEPRRARGPGDRMVQAGVGIVVAGLAGYGLMAVGLAIGNRAEGDLLPLAERDDISARRAVLERGRLGNRLAIAGAVTATAALAVGIPLIVIGRRRHEAASPRAVVLVEGGTTSVGLRIRGRF